jgi:hypothetical protein
MRALDVQKNPREFNEEFVLVVCPTIGDGSLRIGPDILGGIELGSVRGQGLQAQATHPAEKFPDRRALVNLSIVEKNDDFSPDMQEQVSEKVAHVLGVDVGAMETEVQPGAVPTRAHRYCGDDRNLLTSLPMAEKRGLAPRCPSAQHQWAELEAGFVHENYVGAQPPGVFFTRGHSRSIQCLIASSSRSKARFSGF